MRNMKTKIAAVMAMLMSIICSFAVFAESAGSANSATVTAMTGLASDMTATGSALIPIALGVVGLGLVVIYGVKIFRKIAKP